MASMTNLSKSTGTQWHNTYRSHAQEEADGIVPVDRPPVLSQHSLVQGKLLLGIGSTAPTIMSTIQKAQAQLLRCQYAIDLIGIRRAFYTWYLAK
ncbi:hypothetical protein SLA2020_268600 [Shorea laevis]